MYSKQRTSRLMLNLLIASVIVAISFFGITYQTPFVVFFTVVLLVCLSSWFVLSMKKNGLASFLASLVGCWVLILTIIFPTNIPITGETLDPKAFSTGTVSQKVAYLEHTRTILKENAIYVGILNLAIGFLIAYRPNIIYVKNRLPFEYPYPIWNSKKSPVSRFSPQVIKVRSLFTEKEKWIIFKYRFVLVLIDKKIYLAKTNDIVPENTILLRSESGNSVLGV